MTTKVRVGSEVVFKDRFGEVREGSITRFEQDDAGKITGASIKVPGDISYLINLSKIALKGTPLAAEFLAPVVHLTMGTMVEVHDLPAGKKYGGVGNGDIGVVLADKGDRVNVALLGGTGKDEYGRFPHRCLSVVDRSFFGPRPVAS